MDPAKIWNERFAATEYVYGTNPNDFLVECLSGRRIGCAFSVAEGEGRNAVWMAEHGAQVHSIDASVKGVEKTLRLAKEHGVTVDAQVGLLEQLQIRESHYDTIVSVFAHMPRAERALLHNKLVRALKPDGLFVFEAYSPNQPKFDTGGPKDLDLLVTVDDLRTELAGLNFLVLHEVERNVVEGSLHTGKASVVQCMGIKR